MKAYSKRSSYLSQFDGEWSIMFPGPFDRDSASGLRHDMKDVGNAHDKGGWYRTLYSIFPLPLVPATPSP